MTVTPVLTPLDERVLEHLATIVFTERRPASFIDFKHLSPSHGVIRNSFYRLRKNGKIELAYNSGIAFYTLTGQPFTKPVTVTPGGYGGQTAQRNDPLIEAELKKLPFQERALHDLRLLFNLPGSWDILSTNTKHRLHPANKDIQIEPFRSRDGKTEIRITIHKTDNISVLLACSQAPIVQDYNGVFRLGNELTRAEEYLARELELAAKLSERGAKPVIPDHLSWICTHYHLGRDSLQEYNSQRFNTAYEDMQGALVRIYSKEFADKKRRIRVERLESPNKPLIEIVNGILDGNGGAAAQ